MSMGKCGICWVPVSRNENRCDEHLHIPEPDRRTDEEKARGVHPARAANRFILERFEPWTLIRSDRHPCKVHVVAPAEAHRPQNGGPGTVYAFCGVGAYSSEKGPKVRVHTTTSELPAGETWCGTCLGKALAYLGQADEMADLLLKCLEPA